MLKFMSRVLLVITVTLIFFSIYASLSKVYPFNWSVILKYRRLFFDGLMTTLRLSVTALGLSLLVGFIIALFRTSRILVLEELGMIYVWFFRNMPLLVIILLIYYGIGSVVAINRFWAGVISLALFEGAYVGEIFRAGIEAVPRGEIEAGEALGMYKYQIMGSIIFPRALRISIPPLVGQMVSLVKDSSLVSVIALGDLTMRARQVGTQTLASLEAYLVLAGFYLAITSLLSLVGRYLERRLAIP
ncbi:MULTISPECIES: amino acid ABC transporter permease [Kosmotoga]|uniref:Polar amino acid ABC transporter, inner membrane subunit n=1 Tax=Kosmotoga olearia (strain ATCC BAA-1733 / DSM 21960 / TBF 19.5.1) TaxID=521045 RepID=C5CFF2_KOSOT|nr:MULTISPECIES: amino acid ABC transporter permease [Kosmotoga]ACR80361.1 polar amino acid ABC transporter, inner membrane subunit [Kosmotoga olearia TBF 19.5.1]MDI3523795.1 polar amino acid transport system permease protein [Kosmotoga sp.]MDK2953339.1 polar amino acid transport system permease protein [Kosmotoga sp.]OAA19979.1 polar amino acid ABC transporter permease [Kosmotoga sp. DU53]